MIFAKNLKKLRARKRISQEELGNLLGVTQRTISHYEDGTSQPTIESLILISNFFQVSIDDMVKAELL